MKIFLILASMLIAVELSFRALWPILWPQDTKHYVVDADFGIKYKPGYYTNTDKPSPIGFTGNINSLGYRGHEWKKEKAPGVTRIIAVGDSVVLGLGTTRDGADWPTQLGLILGPKYEVLNAGLGGNTSANVLYRLETELLEYKPDLILVSVGSNDMNIEHPGAPRAYRSAFWTFVFNHCYALRALAGLVYKKILPAIPWDDSEKRAIEFIEFYPREYANNLWDIACLESRVIFLTTASSVNTKGWRKVKFPYYAQSEFCFSMLFHRFNRVVTRYTLLRESDKIDMAGYFQNLPNGAQYFGDNVHLTDEGYRLYAEEIARRLKP